MVRHEIRSPPLYTSHSGCRGNGKHANAIDFMFNFSAPNSPACKSKVPPDMFMNLRMYKQVFHWTSSLDPRQVLDQTNWDH